MSIIKSLVKNFIITPEVIGKSGENRTAAKLGWANFWGHEGKILRNVYIPHENNKTTEADLLYITVKGILVIESKNYSGFIFGNESSRNWTSTLYAGKDWLGRKKVEKHQFYNPVWQNNTHIKALKNYLDKDIEMISVIVFSERCELKDVSVSARNTYICKRDKLPATINRIWKEYPDIFTYEKVEEIYNRLLPLSGQDDSVKQNHIADIREKFDNNDACPLCGQKLVVRTVKNGPNAGKQFLGCSGYPKCRYTKNI